MVRRLLFATIGLAPIVIVLDWTGVANQTVLFVLAALALVPLAWLIGEATEQAAEYTGPGIGGFLNATFGNAPELIIALLAVNQGLTEVVRGSLTGSVIGNLLLVLGAAVVAGRGDPRFDRRSSMTSMLLLGTAVVLLGIPSVLSWTGDPDRKELAWVSLPIAIFLLVLYVIVTAIALIRHRSLHVAGSAEIVGWTLRQALLMLGVATVLTALVAETLVGSLEHFAHQAGLSEFFVATVIVAIVGNAAEHGGAVIVAWRGKVNLAVEIAISSAAQVAVFLIPAVAILSWAIDPLALGFRVVEIAALTAAFLLVLLVLRDGRATHSRGVILLLGYAACATAFYIAGDRPY